MKALVTGAAGFIGSHLAERLIADGATVVGLDAFTDFYARAEKEDHLSALRKAPAFTLVEDTLADVDLDRLLTGVTHVFHLAAQAGVRKSWGRDFGVYSRSNVEGTQVLLEACVGRPLERFVFASTSSVYGDEATLPMREDARPQPVSPYGVTKLAAEHLCHLYHHAHRVPTVALRYFTVYGPRQRPDMGFRRFFDAIMRNKPLPLFGDGRQTRDFTYVADAVAATASAATRGTLGAVYNIGGGSRVQVLDVFELIAKVTGAGIRVESLEPQPGDMRDTYADTSRARADLAFSPAVSLEQGLRAEYDWIMEMRSSHIDE
jgi:UDP-glucose 4-epimerase